MARDSVSRVESDTQHNGVQTIANSTQALGPAATAPNCFCTVLLGHAVLSLRNRASVGIFSS